MLYLLFFSFIIHVSCGQKVIRIGIIDDINDSVQIRHINISNLTLCGENNGLQLELYWLNASDSLQNLLEKLEFEENLTNIYLTRTIGCSTVLVRDFCRANYIPFFNAKLYDRTAKEHPRLISSNTQEHALIYDILPVLISYFKYNHIQSATYIYDNEESQNRIYEFLRLMNMDEYFNSFSLDIRTIIHEDIYSILYNIESNFVHQNEYPKHILLDLHSYDDYERIFEKISHMGLTSHSYRYIILPLFDVCTWVNRFNFVGHLIYFGSEQHDCIVHNHNVSNTNNDTSTSLSTNFKYYKLYYHSKLSFRSEHDTVKIHNSTQLSTSNNSSSLLLSNKTNSTSFGKCNYKLNRKTKYIEYSYFKSQISSTLKISSYTLFDELNYLIDIIVSNRFDCKTNRFKQLSHIKNKSMIDNIFIYSNKRSRLNEIYNQPEIIGKYSFITNQYDSCQIDKYRQSTMIDKLLKPRIYYITSLLDEPFLMLNKQSYLYRKYSQPDANLKELHGRIFNINELQGFCADLAERVCSILNITCQFRLVEDGNFGSKNMSTGLWNGMIGEIVSRKADMAIAPLTISPHRMEAVDFSKPFMNLGISIMIRKPDVEKPGVFSFMNPVSMEIWLCFSLAYCAVSVVLFLTSRVVNSGWQRRVVRRPSYRSFSYPKSVNDRRKSEIELQRHRRESLYSETMAEMITTRRQTHCRTRHSNQRIAYFNIEKSKELRKQNKSKHNSVHLFGISNALFFSFASFMRQSINLVPKSMSGRIAATSWWYFSLIFISSYTANLVAFLTVENLVTPIEGVEDLAKQQEIKYGALRNGTTSAFFEKSNVTVFQHMWIMMQKSSSEVFVATNDEGVKKVRSSKGKYAFFIESTKNEYVNERLPCDTMKVGSDLDSKGYGIATGLGSDLTEAVNIIVTNLRESGFLDKLKQRWWYERSECSQLVKDKRFSELSLSSVTGLFYIFLFGVILSCIIAFTEFLITVKAESEALKINFRDILRIKMVENMVGITINKQRQAEHGCFEIEETENDKVIQQYTDYQLKKTKNNA